MARLFADEDFPQAVVEALRALGHEVETVAEVGRQGIDDAAQLAYASARNRAVLTHNRRDFIRLHRQGTSHAGIFVCTRDSDGAALTARIHQKLSATAVLANLLLRVNRPHTP